MAFDPTSADVQSFSGAPSPPPPLSGLLFGGGMGLSGAGAGAGLGGGRGAPGMEGGPGLDILSLLSQLTAGGDTGGALRPGLGQPLGGGGTSLGPSAAGFDMANPFFQTIGQQGIAGQTAGQMQGGQGSQGDILSLLKSLFSVGQKGTGLFQSLQHGRASGTDLQTGTGQVGGFTLSGQPGPASPTIGGVGPQDFQGSLLGTDILSDPTLQLFTRGLLTGSLTPESITAFDTLSPTVQQQYANALFGGQIGPSLGESLQAGNTSGFSLGGIPLTFEGGPSGTNSLFGNLGLGDLGTGFGLLGGAAGLARDIQSGNPGGAIKDVYSLYANVAPLLSQATGQEFPTLGSFLSGLGNFLGIGGTIGATGVGAGSAFAPAALAGATAPELASLGATGAELAGAGTTGLLAAGGSALGAGVLGAGLGAAAYPYIQAILNGISQMFNAGFSDQEQKKLLGNLKEAKRNIKNIGFATPIIQQGAGLPQALLAAEQSGDPAQIARQVELARYISDQGPALSQVQPGIKGWGPFKNPFAGNQGFSQAMSQDMHNAFAAYSRGIADLQRMGALTPNVGEGTLMFNGQPMFGGSSPIDPRSLFNMMGNDPFGYGALYRGWFPPSTHGQGGGGGGGGVGWTPPSSPVSPPLAASGGLMAPSGPNANTAAFQQMIQQNLSPLGIQSASLMAPGGGNDQTAQFLQMLMQNLGPLGIQVA